MRPPLGLRADLASLASLLLDPLFRVLDALCLVRVRYAQRADPRRHLAHHLLVGAEHLDLLWCLESERHPRGRIDLDGMREAERELQLLPGEHGAVPRAADLEITSVTRGDAGDHVLKERAWASVQRVARVRVALALHDHRPVLARHAHIRMEGADELALRSLHADRVSVDLHVDALVDRDWEATDAAHITRCRRGLPRPDPSSRRPARS